MTFFILTRFVCKNHDHLQKLRFPFASLIFNANMLHKGAKGNLQQRFKILIQWNLVGYLRQVSELQTWSSSTM